MSSPGYAIPCPTCSPAHGIGIQSGSGVLRPQHPVATVTSNGQPSHWGTPAAPSGPMLNLFRNRPRRDTWRELARQWGLQSRRNWLWPGTVYVSGRYREHEIALYGVRGGRIQLSTTHIEIDVRTTHQPTFHIRGPYRLTTLDKEIDTFFATPQFSIGDTAFYVTSQPERIAPYLFSTLDTRCMAWRNQFPTLRKPVNLELTPAKLLFSQMGLLEDRAYLQFLFDWLSELALVVEGLG